MNETGIQKTFIVSTSLFPRACSEKQASYKNTVDRIEYQPPSGTCNVKKREDQFVANSVLHELCIDCQYINRRNLPENRTLPEYAPLNYLKVEEVSNISDREKQYGRQP